MCLRSGLSLTLTCVMALATCVSACTTEDGGAAKASAKAPLKSGDYYMGLQAAPFGNLKLFFKVAVTVRGKEGGGGTIDKLSIRSVSVDGWVSDEIGAATAVAIDKDGKFEVSFAKLVMPAKTTPTGTDVEVMLVLKGTIHGDTMFCGDVGGMVPTFSADLVGSKFKAVPWGTQTDPPESACETAPAKVYGHVATCPAIDGASEVTLTSAEIERHFKVYLPKGGAPAAATPIVFLYHGVGGTGAKIVNESGFAKLLDTEKFILVVPESATIDGKKLNTDWYYGSSLFDLDNPDLVFFDDMLNCVGKAYSVDSKRVYVTGMSGGGLMSTFASLHRSEVIAAAAPFSGGYLHKWPKHKGMPGIMVTWGGPTDEAYEQNFDTMAKDLIARFTADGDRLVSCEHTLGHKWPPEMTVAAWTFLSAFELGATTNPLSNGLDAVFPKYCKVIQ